MTEELGSTVEAEVVVPEAIKTEIEVTKSMDDTLRDALADIKSKNAEQEQGLPAQDKAPLSDEEKAARIRDEKGKFAKTEQSKEAAPEQVAAPVVVPVEIQRLGFRKEEAEAFAAAPEALKAAILRRSDEMFKGIEQYKQSHEYATQIDRAISPYSNTLRELNLTPERAVAEMMASDHKLRHGSPQEKTAFFAQLGRSYGIDMGQVAQTMQSQPQIDPNVGHLQSKISQMEGWIQNQTMMGQRQEQEALNSEISKFAADPSHSHFENVKGHMAALLQAGQAKDLADAYEQAIYANPTTRAAVLAKQQADAQAEASKKAQAAKNAASTNVKRRPSMPVAQPIGSMDQTITARLKALRAA